MKSVTLILTGILFYSITHAQVVSFSEVAKLPAENKEPAKTERLKQYVIPAGLSAKEGTKKINKEIDSVIGFYYQQRLFVLAQDTIVNKDEVIRQLNKKRDSIIAEKDGNIRKIEYWEKSDRWDEIHNDWPQNRYQRRNFFPAYFSSQAMRFFEGDTTHVKLFQNNLINYSPKTKKMILYTEVLNDYLGPFRVGIGFQIESEAKVDSLSTADSTKKLENKTDLLAAIQSGGGDFSVNVKYPLIKTNNDKAVLQSKIYLYGNTGFSLPVLNKASDDFLFNYDLGIEGALYARGFNGRLTFYAQLKAAYYAGNKNYKKIITDADKDDPASFFMLQTSFGLDFLDGYRIKVDLFHGGNFIKKNFPASVTFIVRPGKKN